MDETIDYQPPSLEYFMSGIPTTVEAFRVLVDIFDHLEESPAFLGVSCDAYRPEALKLLRRTPEYQEVALVMDDEHKTELNVIFFGLTQCRITPLSHNGARTSTVNHLRLLQNSHIYRDELRNMYSLKLPKRAGEAMTFAFERQNAIVTELMDGIISHPSFSSFNLKRNDTGDYIDVKVLGPPFLKLLNAGPTDKVNWAANHVMETNDDRLFPRDEIFDINQKRSQNRRGHLLFDGESVTIMEGKLRFRIVKDSYLEAYFVADSMRKVAGTGC